jgi:glycosyltransferase involved in cell wall biosynthesis
MKIAVITPYHNPDSPYLNQCITSVQDQSYKKIMHVMIGDGCSLGATPTYQNLHNIALPKNLNNYGDSPRSIGVVYAFSLGVDAVMFLDSDNWYAPFHVETMVKACIAVQSDVVTSRRYLSHLNGSVLGICPESDGVIFCDTNCLMITRRLAEEAGVWWLIPEDMHVIDDRFVWDTLIHATDKITSTNTASVFYRTAFEFHYRLFNLAPPLGTKPGNDISALGSTIETLQHRARLRARHRQG